MASFGSIFRFLLVTLSFVLVLLLGGVLWHRSVETGRSPLPSYAPQSQPKAVATRFSDNFAGTGTLEETGNLKDSRSPDWWLSSGGQLLTRGGYAQTTQGDLPGSSKWLRAYAANNPTDT